MQTQTVSSSYKKLIVYQKSKSLALLIYKLTKKFPKEEQYVLLPQMRRAALSVSANIVEGYVKSSTKEFLRFLDISIGSLVELEFFVDISYDLRYTTKTEQDKLSNLIIEVRKLIYGYKKSLRAKIG